MRRGLILASAAVLVVALAAAGFSKSPRPTYERADVVRALAAHGYALTEPSGFGWTGYAPLEDGDGVILFPRSTTSPRFYVFVARRDATARAFYEQLTRLGRTPDTFDLARGNVLVSSDSTFTDDGLRADEKRRIRAAINSLVDRTR